MYFTQDELAGKKDFRVSVGHYGCDRLDRLVRVRPPRGSLHTKPHPTQKFVVPCPCGWDHIVTPMWRWATPKEREDAELTLRLADVVG